MQKDEYGTGNGNAERFRLSSLAWAAGTAALAMGCSSAPGASGNPDGAAFEAEGAGIDAGRTSDADSPSNLSLVGLGGDVACQLPPDQLVHTFAPTYHAIYQEVLGPTCGVEFCHGGTADYLQLWSEAEGYQSLLGAPAQGPACAPVGLLRVDPGHPATSLLYLKLTTSPPCGSRMPLEYGCAGGLDPREVEQIRSWIENGALEGDGG